jgi:hypothetical protein
MTVTTTAPVKTGFVGAAETSEVGAINDLAGFVAQDDGWADTVDTAGGTLTISAAAMVNGSYRITGGTTSTITTDTAANIIAALKNAQGGKRFDFLLVNGGSGTATMSGGTGVTIVGTSAPTTGKNQLFIGVVTGAATVSLIAVSSAYL